MPTPGREKDVEDIEILVIILNAPDPVATATEVADGCGISRQGAHNRLQQLEEQGLVQSVMKGARLWWLTDEGLARIGAEAAQSGDS
jgi:predicted ArsR family transcriptional regulator